LFPVGSATIDLSKATKLRVAVFRPESPSVKWITAAFQTTIPSHRELQKVSIVIPYSLAFIDGVEAINRSGTAYGEWMDLDRLLVKFWESCSTRPKVVCMAWGGCGGNTRGFTECFFPELTRRGAIDVE